MKRNEKWRGIARFLLRLLGSGIVLILTFYLIEWESLMGAFQDVLIWRMLAAAAVWMVAFISATLRWQVLLHAIDIRLPLLMLVALNFSSFFYGKILPGAVSGDVLKTIRLGQKQGCLEEIALSVTADRVVGLLVVGTFALSGVFSAPEIVASLELSKGALIVMGSILVAALMAGGIVIVYWPKLLGRFPWWQERADKVVSVLVMYWRSPSSIALSLLLSLVFQLAWVYMVWIIFTSFDIVVPFVVLLWAVALVNIITFLPISVGGLGVREGALVLLLSLYGIPAHQVMAASLSYFALGAGFAAVGGVVEAIGNVRGWPLLSAQDASIGAKRPE